MTAPDGPLLCLALAQVDSTVGDLGGNAARVIEQTARAAAAGAHLVAFPEMMLTGYPPEDLVLRPSFRRAGRAALQGLARDLAGAGLGDVAVVVGYLDEDAGARNAAAFVLGGAVVARYFKHHLPNYGVFDERRYFVPGDHLVVVRHRGTDVGLAICEDLWQDGGPFAVARAAGVDLMVVINGSPYERNKDDVRLPLVRRRAAEAGATVAYVNAVGAQDDLVFDGDSMVVRADGQVLMRAPQFAEGLHVLDLAVGATGDGTAPVPQATVPGWRVVRHDTGIRADPTGSAPTDGTVADRLGDEAQVWGALVLGLRDYVTKNGFSAVLLGLSGGIDSAVCAAIAADAIGGENVFGVSMPSAYSSDHSRSDAADLAGRIGAHYRTVRIGPMVDAFVEHLSLQGVAEENVQARVRGTTLMGISNGEGQLVLATGNKSELAVGYSTVYGDAVGGFAPLKDVPKTLVWQLARWRNERAAARSEVPPVPENSIDKAPSAELRPGQLDADSLPDYAVLDQIIERYVDGDEDIEAIVAAGFEADLVARVARMVDAAEWKRRQYPPGPKISFKSFGKDRRLPITNRWREPRA
ncbi:MAG: NAD+ synthase [Jatrophihabitans sp.]|nr:MAG: NAD+ synthase [Jatrophihabitans sp.]